MEQVVSEQYRKDQCTCGGGIECDSDKRWRKQHRERKLATHTVSLEERLTVAQEKLAQATVAGEQVKVRNYRAQVRMIQGRMKKVAAASSSSQ